MNSLIGRQYSTLRLHTSVHAEGFGALGPVIGKDTPAKGAVITLTRVAEGVLVTFKGKVANKDVPDFLIESNAIQSGSLRAEGAIADKAVTVSKPQAPAGAGNPLAAGVPGNSGGGGPNGTKSSL